MTAINTIIKKDRAIVLCDSAGYSLPDGIVMTFYDKALPIGGLRAVVAVRGSAIAPRIFAEVFEDHYGSFDEIVATAKADLVEHYFWINQHQWAESGEPHLNIFLAGWSESRNRPEAYFLETAGDRAFEWRVVDGGNVVAPVPDHQAAQRAGMRILTSTDDFDPVKDGLALLEAQRLTLTNAGTSTGGKIYGVGGEARLFEITRDEVTVRVLKTWPDEIGRPITPDNLPKLNRQQRRAAARKAA